MKKPSRRWILIPAATVAAALCIAGSEHLSAPLYEVAAVKGKLVRDEPAPKLRLELGARPAAGELLRTGWRSSAEIAAPEAAAHFRLGPSTRVRLASERPGVLLELERGRLHAIFDKLAADPPPERVVTTPSAVLAVRGTEYGVEVTHTGDTEVVVFVGVVDVRDLTGEGEWVRVQEGHQIRVRLGQPPGQPHPQRVSPAEWDRGWRPESGPGQESRGVGSKSRGSGPDGQSLGGPGAGGPPHGSGRHGD